VSQYLYDQPILFTIQALTLVFPNVPAVPFMDVGGLRGGTIIKL